MSDISLVRTSNQDFDIDFDGEDVSMSDSLQNAVILSLAIWNRSEIASGVAATRNVQGGWWADALNELPLGSKLYTVFRERLDESSLEKAKGMVKDALQWLIDDGVAKDVSVSASIAGRTSAEFVISVSKPDGDDEEFKWKTNWEASV